jgi:CBS domain containing-hemolysin-like protein
VNWWALVWMLLLLVANGFFVAAEFAYIAARRNVLEQRQTASARAAVRLTRDLSLSLAAAQLGITMASLLLGFVAEPAVAAILERGLAFLQLPPDVLHAIALAVALIIVVFLHMVVGEMAPKNIAISAPERAALVMALPMRAFIIVFRPAITLLNGIANTVLRLFGVPPVGALDVAHSAEDLAAIIGAGRREGVIEDFAHRLLTRAIVFGDCDASAVMVPRPDVVAAPADATVAEIEDLIERTGHSRIPIHTGDLDDVIGFMHAKDLLDVDDEARDLPLDGALIRPLGVVPEMAPLRTVLGEMRRTRHHLALVVDEYGGTAGIITLEDIVEELVGDIRDEHDPRSTRVRTLEGGAVIAAGSVRAHELAPLGLELPEGDYETIGGLVMDRLGRIPRRGDVVETDGWRIQVVRMDGRRVGEVEITREPRAGRE